MNSFRTTEDERYFYWLLDQVDCEDIAELIDEDVARRIHETEFTWFVPNDDNRASDGIHFRERYSEDYCPDRPCSVLEMLVAFAVRIEETIMGEPGEENPARWFELFIRNLSLDRVHIPVFDRQKVDEILQIFLKREYQNDGFGILFPVEKQDKNRILELKKQEIWYQMHWYLHEHFS